MCFSAIEKMQRKKKIEILGKTEESELRWDYLEERERRFFCVCFYILENLSDVIGVYDFLV